MKFSKKRPAKNVPEPTTTNYAGGASYSNTDEMAITLLTLNSFLSDQYYQTGEQQIERLADLCQTVDPLFLAKLAIYSRTVYGMRSTSHVIAGELSRLGSGKDWITDFFRAIPRRPDDMLEIASYALSKYGYMSNAMKRGFRGVLGSLSAYQLAKYKSVRQEFKMVDLVNLTHPKSEAIGMLMTGNLAPANTWETNLGSENKGETWKRMLNEGSLGYLALLRNMRNIEQQGDPETVKIAVQKLTDPNQVRKSMTFPFQFYTAFVELEKAGCRQGAAAVLKALELSLDNVPQWSGKTLVALDSSGSMTFNRQKNGRSILEVAAIFTAALSRMGDTEVMLFDNKALPFPVRPDSIATTTQRLIKASTGGGTNFSLIFKYMGNRWFDRVVIISDMQSWVSPTYQPYIEYANRHRSFPFVHSFDLAGLGTSQFTHKTASYGGVSSKVLEVMQGAETDPDVLLNDIKGVRFFR